MSEKVGTIQLPLSYITKLKALSVKQKRSMTKQLQVMIDNEV
jgi:hypothetical protein